MKSEERMRERRRSKRRAPLGELKYQSSVPGSCHVLVAPYVTHASSSARGASADPLPDRHNPCERSTAACT